MFAEMAAQALDVELAWQGEGIEETAVDRKTGKGWVKINKQYYRPAEVDLLMGDSSKAQEALKWKLRPTCPRLSR